MPLKHLSVGLRKGQENSITKNKNTYRVHMWLYEDLHEQVKFNSEAILFPEARPATSANLTLFSTTSLECHLNMQNRKCFTKLYGK